MGCSGGRWGDLRVWDGGGWLGGVCCGGGECGGGALGADRGGSGGNERGGVLRGWGVMWEGFREDKGVFRERKWGGWGAHGGGGGTERWREEFGMGV